MLTQERANMITDFINSDEDRAVKLMELAPAEAVKQMNTFGKDFTVEEIVEYGELARAQGFGAGEIDAAELDNVAGGCASATWQATPKISVTVW